MINGLIIYQGIAVIDRSDNYGDTLDCVSIIRVADEKSCQKSYEVICMILRLLMQLPAAGALSLVIGTLPMGRRGNLIKFGMLTAKCSSR